MRMRIARAHHGAAVLENLDMADEVERSQFAELFDPCIHDGFDLCRSHGSQSEVVARRKADHPADSRLSFSDDEPGVFEVYAIGRRVLLERGEVVLENEGGGVGRISNPTGAGISGTEIAGGIVGGLGSGAEPGDFSLPWPRGAVRRNQHPFIGQGIQPPVRIFCEFHLAF